MTADKPPAPKQTLTIRLKARSAKDLAAALSAVTAALPPRVTAEVCSANNHPDAVQPDQPTAKDDQLATKTRELIAALSDQIAAEADKKTASAVRDTERLRAEIVAQRGGFRAYVLHWTGQGYRITVELVEKVFGQMGSVVSNVLGGKKHGG